MNFPGANRTDAANTASRRALLTGIAAAALFPASGGSASTSSRPAFRGESRSLLWHDTPRPLPDLPITAGDGTDHGLNRFRGRVLVVNFWATWCAPCVKEMPALLRLARARPAISVLALSQDRGGAPVVEAFYRAHGLVGGLDVWLDPRGRLGRASEVRGLPTTLIVDRDGRELARLEGAAEWDSAAALAVVDAV